MENFGGVWDRRREEEGVPTEVKKSARGKEPRGYKTQEKRMEWVSGDPDMKKKIPGLFPGVSKPHNGSQKWALGHSQLVPDQVRNSRFHLLTLGWVLSSGILCPRLQSRRS